MPPTIGGVTIDPQGQTLTVTITPSAKVYTDAAGSSLASFPASVTTRMSYWMSAAQQFTISVKTPQGVEIADGVGNPLVLDIQQGTMEGIAPVVDRPGPEDQAQSGPYALAASLAALDALAPLKRALDAGKRSCAIQVLADSTANDPVSPASPSNPTGTIDWPYRFAMLVAAQYPNWTVRRILWDDTTQAFMAPDVIQTGTAGVLYLDGNSSVLTARQLDPSVSTHLTGVIDVRVKVRLATYDVAQDLVAKSGTAGNREWLFSMTTTGSGRPSFTWSVDGTAQVVHTCNNVPAPAADGTDIWLRAVWNPNNAGNTTTDFYTSTDGITYTQIGTTQTTVGTAALFNATTVGYQLGGHSAMIAGERVYEVQIRDGLNGPNVVPALPDLWTPQTSGSAACVGAPVFTVVCAAKAGADIVYLSDATRLPKMTPNHGQKATFLNSSHNDNVQIGKQWYATYKAWADAVRAQVTSPLVILTQNPEQDAAVNHEWHEQRARDLHTFARHYSYGLIDTFKMFEALGKSNYETNFMADTVHPNTAGMTLWANLVKSVYDAATA